jgi:AraC family transcriptional regulator
MITSTLTSPPELHQKLNKFLVLSSQQMGWNGIAIEQYQEPLNPCEVEFPALPDHLLRLSGHSVRLTHKQGDRLHEAVAQQIAKLFLAELNSGGMMGQLYVESLTQILVIHLLRHYLTITQTFRSERRSLTRTQLQQAIDYIHAHLERDLSLVELAKVINISPTYFATLFKGAMGISPHQYVIQQRVQRAKEMLKKTDLAIADIALQVGFSSQSHLTQQFKRLTGMTPKQIR